MPSACSCRSWSLEVSCKARQGSYLSVTMVVLSFHTETTSYGIECTFDRPPFSSFALPATSSIPHYDRQSSPYSQVPDASSPVSDFCYDTHYKQKQDPRSVARQLGTGSIVQFPSCNSLLISQTLCLDLSQTRNYLDVIYFSSLL